MTKNILIVCNVFPPSKDIGGRRWGKFAEALHANGYNVHVITTNEGVSNIDIGKLPTYIFSRSIINNKYPKILKSYPRTIIDKIKYRLALRKVKKTTKGNYYDRGIFCEQELFQIVEKKIKEFEFEKVIVSGGPFSFLYYLSKWKSKLKYQLVSDIRDPWTAGESYGIRNMSDSRLQEEKRREKLVITESDIVSVPGLIMKQQFENEYNNSNTIILPHGYCEEEFLKIAVRNVNEKKIWIYGGTLYPESLEVYKTIFDYVEKKKSGISLNVYSRSNSLDMRIYEGVVFKDLVTPAQFNQICQESNAFIWVFPEKFKDFFSTKLYELIRCRIPIIYIGFPGQFSDFIVQNRLGVFIETCQLINLVDLVDRKFSELVYNSEFPIENYEIRNLIKMII